MPTLIFCDENKLDASTAQLIFWQKISSPLTVIVMCLLAFPFVLGVQRQSNVGHRLLIGILLGLVFVVVNRLVTQLAVQFGFNAILVALLPSLIFLAVAHFPVDQATVTRFRRLITFCSSLRWRLLQCWSC